MASVVEGGKFLWRDEARPERLTTKRASKEEVVKGGRAKRVCDGIGARNWRNCQCGVDKIINIEIRSRPTLRYAHKMPCAVVYSRGLLLHAPPFHQLRVPALLTPVPTP
jgi:hypothetical protein